MKMDLQKFRRSLEDKRNKKLNDTTHEWKDLLWHIIIVTISTFGSALVDGGLTILIPFYIKDILNENVAFSATLFAMTSLGQFVSHPVTGIMVAHTSCECIIIVSCVIHFIAQLGLYASLIMIPLDTSYYCWCAMCFVIGLTQSLSGVSTEAYISLHIPVHKRGRFMTYQVVINRVAYMFGSFSNGLLSIYYSIQITLLLNSMITVFFGIVVFLLFIPPNYHMSPINMQLITSLDDFTSLWKKIGLRNRFKIDHWILKSNKNDTNMMHMEDADSLYKVLMNNWSILCKLSILCLGQLYSRKSREFILTFQANTLNMENKQIAYINTYSYIPDIAVFVLPGYLMDRFGRKYSIIPSLLCLIVASIFISFTDNYGELSLIAILFGFGDGLANGSLNTIASDVAPSDYHGRAKFIGLFYMICAIPTIISPIIIGNLASNVSLFYASLSSVFFAIISLLWTIFVLPETSKYHSINTNKLALDESTEYKESVPLIATE